MNRLCSVLGGWALSQRSQYRYHDWRWISKNKTITSTCSITSANSKSLLGGQSEAEIAKMDLHFDIRINVIPDQFSYE
jgi:hypothetical protein